MHGRTAGKEIGAVVDAIAVTASIDGTVENVRRVRGANAGGEGSAGRSIQDAVGQGGDVVDVCEEVEGAPLVSCEPTEEAAGEAEIGEV